MGLFKRFLKLSKGRIGILGTTYTKLDFFIKAIQSGTCPPGSFVSVPLKAPIKQIKLLTATLASGHCPPRLTIGILNSTDVILKHFKRTLVSGKAPKQLCLSFSFPEHSSTKELRALKSIILANKRPPELILQLTSPNKLPKLTDYLFKALKKTSCPYPLSLNLDYPLDKEDFERIRVTLCSGRCPKGFSLTISRHPLSDEELLEMAAALKSGNCPIDFKLSFPNQQLNDNGATHFAGALRSGNCPQGFHFDPGHLIVTEEGIKSIFNALITGKCPVKFAFTCEKSPYTTKLPDYLARALSSKNCPPGLALTFKRSAFDAPNDNSERAHYLAQALSSGNCPNYLTLNFQDQLIEDKGVHYLAAALESGKCPFGLTLNLNKNSITDKAVELLAAALSSGNCPIGLTISLLENTKFTEKAERAFFDKINLQTPPPIGLQIYFSSQHNQEALNRLTKSWQPLSLAYTIFLQGQFTLNKSEAQLPASILEHIFSFVMATQQSAYSFKLIYQKIETIYEKRDQKIASMNSQTSGSRFFVKRNEKNSIKNSYKTFNDI